MSSDQNSQNTDTKFLGKVTKQFESDSPEELSLRPDDLVVVNRRIDKFWFHCRYGDREGNFPVGNVADFRDHLTSFNLKKTAVVYVTKEAFSAEENGDLGFKRGSIVQHEELIDENWARGHVIYEPSSNKLIVGGPSGIFPVTHVWTLNLHDVLPSEPATQHSTANSVSTSERQAPIATGIVKDDLRAQLDSEIDLIKGDKVIIYGVFDQLYYKGECNGRRGIIPKAFVSIAQVDNIAAPMTPPHPAINTSGHSVDHTGGEEAPPSYASAVQNQTSRNDSLEVPKNNGSSNGGQPVVGRYENLRANSGVQSYARTIHTFQGEFANDLSFKPNEIVHLIRHVDKDWLAGELNGLVGIFPKSFVQIIVDVHDHEADQSLDDTGLGDEAEVEEVEFPPDTYARVLFDFLGEQETDLSVRKNALITLLKKVGDEWLIAMDDNGKIGEIPVVYVEEIAGSGDTSIYENPSYSRNTSQVEEDSISTDIVFDGHNNLNQDLSQLSSLSADFDPLATSSKRPSMETDPNKSPSNSNNTTAAANNSSTSFSLRNIVASRDTSQVIEAHTANNSSSKAAAAASTHSRPAPPRPTTEKGESLGGATRAVASTSGDNSGSSPNLNRSVSRQDSRESRRLTKQLELRECVITELLQSERDYLRDLRVCYAQFEKPLLSYPQLRGLVGNLNEVIQANEGLLRKIEFNTGSDGNGVGRAFLESAQTLRPAYSIFCRNSDEVPGLFEKLVLSDPQVRKVLEAALKKIKEETNCFDIPSLLIKPVQRILKYPLLLAELAKTETNPSQQEELSQAIATMTEMAAEINEFKRRKDLVHKYRKIVPDSSNLSNRLSKMNMHTFRKKGQRFGVKLSSTLGLSSVTKDEEFDTCAVKFHSVEKTLKIFLKDVAVLLDYKSQYLKQSLAVIDAIVEFYGEKSNQEEVQQLRKVHENLINEVWEDLRRQIEIHVVQVLKMLLEKFDSPNHLIGKRADKLLDFEAALKRAASERDPLRSKVAKDELQSTKNNYEALNRQLIEELPKLTDIATQLFLNSIAAFLKIKKLFIGKAAKQALILLDLPLLLSSSYMGSIDVTDIRTTFTVKHNLIVEDLIQNFSIIRFGTKVAGESNLERNHSLRSSSSSESGHAMKKFVGKAGNKSASLPQSTNARESIQNRYAACDIYAVNGDYKELDVMDITIKSGDWVGVVKRQDPMGNTQRWFVDNGVRQGFVPCKYLSPGAGAEAQQQQAMTDWSKPAPPQIQVVGGRPTSSSSPPPGQGYHHNKKQAPCPPATTAPPRPSSIAEPTRTTVNVNMISLDSPPKPSQQRLSGGATTYENILEFDPLSSSSDTSGGGHYTNEPKYEDIADVDEFYVASFAFRKDPDPSGQFLPISFGQTLLVKRKCDLTGNSEWWLVQDRNGRQGYVPGNRLTKYTTVPK